MIFTVHDPQSAIWFARVRRDALLVLDADGTPWVIRSDVGRLIGFNWVDERKGGARVRTITQRPVGKMRYPLRLFDWVGIQSTVFNRLKEEVL